MFSRCRALLFALLFGLASAVLAHGTESHGDEVAVDEQQAASQQPLNDDHAGATTTAPGAASGPAGRHVSGEAQRRTGSGITVGAILDDLTWSEFPTLHPMIVHAPVTLIPLALLISLISLFSARRILVWLSLGLTGAGLVAGYIAAFPAHPHTRGLSEAARLTLEKHDFFAYSTLWLTLAALAVALLCAWKPGPQARAGLCLMLLLASLSVALTGHYGGTLAYVHGIGAQGRFLAPR